MPRTHFGGRLSSAEIIEHFWSKVDKNGPVPEHAPELGACWIWTDYRKENGYGQFYVNRRPVYAHRFAYAITYRPLADDEAGRHKCDNKPCCRPDHIEPGSCADNARDAVERGLIPRGEKRAQAKLSDAQIAAIRQWRSLRPALIPGEVRLLASALSISPGHLSGILSGRERC